MSEVIKSNNKMNIPLAEPYPWTFYSNLLKERILSPRNVGSFEENREAKQEMRVVQGMRGEVLENSLVALYLVVDETDGVIADAKFQAFGESVLIGITDVCCDLLLRKTYQQASHITADLIDKKLRDFSSTPAFPEEASSLLNLLLEALEIALEKCSDIAINDVISPLSKKIEQESYPNWEVLNKEEKIELIKAVIQEDIQPYIELDAGGIEIQDFHKDREVIVAYQGACTTCPSSTGATLHAIQQILQTKVHPELIVKPDLSLLHF